MLTIFRRRSEQTAAVRDAERLIREFGEGAFSAAANMSWREDAGLVASPCSGHWHRVQQEVGRRLPHQASSAPALGMIASRETQPRRVAL